MQLIGSRIVKWIVVTVIGAGMAAVVGITGPRPRYGPGRHHRDPCRFVHRAGDDSCARGHHRRRVLELSA
jgi:hypothetical protein